MTSGQQGGQPPYGPPPQGYPPPYGPGQGYLPAPAAPTGWGHGAPPAMERPVTVRAGLGAFIASLVLGAVGFVVTLLNWDTYVAAALAQAEAQAGSVPEGFDGESIATLGLRIGIGVAIVLTAAYLLFIWFAWKGHNWARIVLWVLGGISVVFGLAGLAAATAPNPFPFVTALGWFQLLLDAVGILLLALKPSNDWYRYRKWLRATGQPG